MKKLFSQLTQDFRDKEYAHGYMESHTVSRLAAQIHTLRKQRGWSQEDLSHKSGIAQERISKIESADFDSLTMKTLQKLSKAFDVHLHIAFVSFRSGIVDIGNLRSEQLEVAERERDLAAIFSGENELEFLPHRLYLSNNHAMSWQICHSLDRHASSGDIQKNFANVKVIKKADTSSGESHAGSQSIYL